MSPKFLILALKDCECDPILLILILFHLSFEIIEIIIYISLSEACFLLSGSSKGMKIDLSKLAAIILQLYHSLQLALSKSCWLCLHPSNQAPSWSSRINSPHHLYSWRYPHLNIVRCPIKFPKDFLLMKVETLSNEHTTFFLVTMAWSCNQWNPKGIIKGDDTSKGSIN